MSKSLQVTKQVVDWFPQRTLNKREALGRVYGLGQWMVTVAPIYEETDKVDTSGRVHFVELHKRIGLILLGYKQR
jgi:hypothetical protein